MSQQNGADINRLLGQRYAQMLKETPAASAVHEDCEEVIRGSLALLEHYNKIRLALRRSERRPMLLRVP